MENTGAEARGIFTLYSWDCCTSLNNMNTETEIYMGSKALGYNVRS